MYYLSILGKEMGPFTLEELQELVKQGRLSEDTIVKVDGKTMKAGEVEGVGWENGNVANDVICLLTMKKYYRFFSYLCLLPCLPLLPLSILIDRNVIRFLHERYYKKAYTLLLYKFFGGAILGSLCSIYGACLCWSLLKMQTGVSFCTLHHNTSGIAALKATIVFLILGIVLPLWTWLILTILQSIEVYDSAYS